MTCQNNSMSWSEHDQLHVAIKGQLGSFELDVKFTIAMSGTTALFGASGSGKTSLLRCIAGLDRLRGRIVVGGDVWQDDEHDIFKKTHQRKIGYVFQEASLFSHLSVRKNLLYGAVRVKGQNKTVQQKHFDDVVELLGIAHLLGRVTTGLSGGERQRVAVGRALLSHPHVLLMDEPLAALDRNTKQEILPYLERLPAELSIPVLYVSHDLSEVARLADRMVLLSSGSLVASGPLDAMLERLDLQPATGRFEASTILNASVLSQDAEFLLTTLDLHGQKIIIPAMDLKPGDALRLRVRARDVTLATDRPDNISIRNVLRGSVVEIRAEDGTAFAETLIDVGGGRLRARITRKAVADLSLDVGHPVFALIKSISFDRRTRL